MITEIKKFVVPSRKDILVLRLMIIIGLLSMVFFVGWLFRTEHFGDTWLYYLLMFVMLFSALKVAAEWYHYFNIKAPVPPDVDRQFTVDIFTTYCAGEPMEMIEETLRAIKAIRYPHESYLCDESNDPYLKEFCRKLGIHHVTRTNKIDAKAGNINNALKQAKGEICVILDPDHVPAPDFLDPVIPYFSDPEIGFVQIVQAYKNIRESIVSRGAAQQTFQFYGPMMMSMNSYGTVLAIGANCTFRRTALDSIGGHAPGLAEDMHTAMQLHAKGWKSVYVPKILARGLVPSSLYAYYKQQLKWSRGVFELLFTSYVKLFKNFTWRQKLHYGTLPLHYFSGVVYLINFLVPILSLVLAVIPLKVDLVQFFLIGTPFLANTLLIRHFVQRWVMEEEERGFHLIGGILQIGTWWVHALGFIYAVLRKKVPYIPTPKDGEEGNNFLLNLPNIAVALISVAAIVYGISIDYNPYTFVMAGLASTNCLFMSFMLLAGQHRKISSFKVKYQTQKYTRGYINKLRTLFWHVKHDVYALVRKVALPVSLLFTVLSFTYVNKDDDPGNIVPDEPKKGHFYTGIFSPESMNGLTTLTAVEGEEQNFQTRFNIVSCYIPWGDKFETAPAEELIGSIVSKGYYPLVTWEPWVSTFHRSDSSADLKNEKKALYHIANGEFDDYIANIAGKIKSLRSPVFLRFAHEPDNPSYPWSPSGDNTPEDFVASWKHLHHIFDSLQVNNVIWVWSPWKHQNLKDYFPGEEYVDWIGVTGLNYGNYNPDGKWYEFEEYYRPFSADSIFQKDIPVIIAEFGSLSAGGNQQHWLENALKSIKNDFPEIRAFVLFNSSLDKNLPQPSSQEELLNWKVSNAHVLNDEFLRSPDTGSNEFQHIFPGLKDNSINSFSARAEFFDNIKGINYRKGNKWFRNFYALTYREVSSDFAKIRDAGANTIKWCGPGIYDRNVLKAAAEHGLDVHYSFWVANDLDFIKDKEELNELADEVLATVKKHVNNQNITSWNIGNAIWENLNNNYYKPDVYHQWNAYLTWLKKLVDEITTVDKRPVTLDLEVSDDLLINCGVIREFIPKIAAFGLIYPDTESGGIDSSVFEFPVFNSDIVPERLFGTESKASGSFISSFQNLGTPTYVAFNGLVDHQGKLKEEFYLLKNKWASDQQQMKKYKFAILKKAFPIEPERKMRYAVLVKEGERWIVSDEDQPDTKAAFSWYLVKTDGYGHGIYMKFLGEGTWVDLVPPENYEDYEILLKADVGNYVIETKTKLHTPLIGKTDGEKEMP